MPGSETYALVGGSHFVPARGTQVARLLIAAILFATSVPVQAQDLDKGRTEFLSKCAGSADRAGAVQFPIYACHGIGLILAKCFPGKIGMSGYASISTS